MRLVWGQPIIGEDFDPDAEGYMPMREPSASVMSSVGGAVGLVMAALVGWALWPMIPPGTDLRAMFLDTRRHDGLVFLLGLLGIGALLVPVHEVIHYLCYPAGDDRGIGVWPRKLMFYAFTSGAITRGRFLASVAMPFLVLTVVLGALLLAAGVRSLWLFGAQVLHASWCGADAIVFALLLTRVPAGAVCRNRGYQTYYVKR